MEKGSQKYEDGIGTWKAKDLHGQKLKSALGKHDKTQEPMRIAKVRQKGKIYKGKKKQLTL